MRPLPLVCATSLVILGSPWAAPEVSAQTPTMSLQVADVLDPTPDYNGGFGSSVAPAGDLNGDGYPDVIVGAPAWDGEQAPEEPGEGRAYVYLGSASGLQPGPTFDPTNQPQAYFGGSVASAGDVDADGYDDIVIGAPQWSGTSGIGDGRAYLYFGSAGGPGGTPTILTPPVDDGHHFGESVASAGDVNADGYDDVIVGSPWWEDEESVGQGSAYVYLGSAAGLGVDPIVLDPDLPEPYEAFGAEFGWSVASAGDVDADGYDDVLVGAPHDDGEETDEGRVYLYFGSATGFQPNPTTVDPADEIFAAFGITVASAGDVNADGHDDIVAGAPDTYGGEDGEGSAYVYLGASDGLQPTPIPLAPTDQAYAAFGSSVATAGDVNHDGYDDVISGAPHWNGEQLDEGRAYLYLGSAGGLMASPLTIDPTNEEETAFGSSVASAGDIDGDGADEVLVGAPDGWPFDAVYVIAANTGPTLAVKPLRCISGPAGKWAVKVADLDGDALSVTARSSNTTLLPNKNLVLSSADASGTLKIKPAAGKSGTATITVKVTDGYDSATAAIKVKVGTAAKNTLSLTVRGMIFGLGGNDVIETAAGTDLLCGLGGADVLRGGALADVLFGGSGNDRLFGQGGDDRLMGGGGADFFSGGPGADTLLDFDAGEGDTKV